MLPCLVSVLLTFEIQGVLKFEKKTIRCQKVNIAHMSDHHIIKTNMGPESYRKLPSNLTFGIRWLRVISVALRPLSSRTHWVRG